MFAAEAFGVSRGTSFRNANELDNGATANRNRDYDSNFRCCFRDSKLSFSGEAVESTLALHGLVEFSFILYFVLLITRNTNSNSIILMTNEHLTMFVITIITIINTIIIIVTMDSLNCLVIYGYILLVSLLSIQFLFLQKFLARFLSGILEKIQSNVGFNKNSNLSIFCSRCESMGNIMNYKFISFARDNYPTSMIDTLLRFLSKNRSCALDSR